MPKTFPARSWLALSSLIALADQLTKHLAAILLDPARPIVLLPWLNLRLAWNSGAAFSMLAGGGRQRALLIGISLTISLLLAYQLWRGVATPRRALALALMLGGAVGNLWDRTAIGYVVDFIDFHLGNWHYPTFNLADSAICVGAGLWSFVSSVPMRSSQPIH